MSSWLPIRSLRERKYKSEYAAPKIVIEPPTPSPGASFTERKWFFKNLFFCSSDKILFSLIQLCWYLYHLTMSSESIPLHGGKTFAFEYSSKAANALSHLNLIIFHTKFIEFNFLISSDFSFTIIFPDQL